jgi:DNA primase
MAPEAVLCFDGDRAGQRAAARAAERALPLLRPEVSIRFAGLPAGEDPDSLIGGKGRAAMAELIDSALTLSDALWRMECGGRVPASPEERAALQKRLEDHAQAIKDPTVRSHVRRSFRERLWPKRPAAESKAGGGKKWASEVNFGASGSKSKRIDADGLQEEILLTTLMRRPEIFDHCDERLGMLSFSAPELDSLRQEVLKTLGARPDLDTAGLERHLRLTGFAAIVDSVLSPTALIHAFFARPETAVETVREGWDEAYERYLEGNVRDEIGAAQQQLAGDMTTDVFGRFRRLMEPNLRGHRSDDQSVELSEKDFAELEGAELEGTGPKGGGHAAKGHGIGRKGR